MSWMDVGASSLRYGNGSPGGGGASKGSITTPPGSGIVGGNPLPAPKPKITPPVQTKPVGESSGGSDLLPRLGTAVGAGINTASNMRGIGTAVGGARMLGGAAAAPAGLFATGALTALDAVRTPFELATGRDSMQAMHSRDMARMSEYGTSGLGRALGYNDAVAANMTRPVASTLALGDAAADVATRVPNEIARGSAYDYTRGVQQAGHARATQQAMAAGTANKQQLADAATAAREERKAMQPSWWNPVYWGL